MLDLPELKPSDTCWLEHERCVKAVKGNYSAIVNALSNIYGRHTRMKHWELAKFFEIPEQYLSYIFLIMLYHKLPS